MSLWALAFRNVWRNRRRSLLTLGIVVFGFASFALAGGFIAQSFEGLRTGTIHSGVGHLQLAAEQTFEGTEEKTLEHGIHGEQQVTSILKASPYVEAVLPRLEFMGLISNGARSVPYLGSGLDPVEDGRVMETKSLITAGRWLTDRHEVGVVLGTGLARALNIRVGDTVTLLATTPDGVLNAQDVAVVGLADVPIKELDDRYLATSIDAASQLLGVSDVVSRFVVMLKSDADVGPARDALTAALNAGGHPLSARTWEELAVFYRQVKLLYVAIFGFMGLILVVVVLLACANTMTMAATERIREIGTLRAIGTPPAHIRRMFVLEGAMLALFGSIAGALLSLLIRAALNASGIMMPPPPGSTHGAPIHVALYPSSYAVGLAAMLLTLALAAYFPARRASKIPIVEALAHV
jgi:putative ABC transport system permease protein